MAKAGTTVRYGQKDIRRVARTRTRPSKKLDGSECKMLHTTLIEFLTARQKFLTRNHGSSWDARSSIEKGMLLLVYSYFFKFFELAGLRKNHFLFDKPGFAKLYVCTLQVAELLSFGRYRYDNMVNELLGHIRELGGYHPSLDGKSEIFNEVRGFLDALKNSGREDEVNKMKAELTAASSSLRVYENTAIQLRGEENTLNDSFIESCLRKAIIDAVGANSP